MGKVIVDLKAKNYISNQLKKLNESQDISYLAHRKLAKTIKNNNIKDTFHYESAKCNR